MKHPTIPPVSTEATARDHIMQSDWFRKLPCKSSGMTGSPHPAATDKGSYPAHPEDAKRRRQLADRTIRVRNSSAQSAIRSSNGGLAPRTYRPSPAEFDADLAKGIADWQVANGAVPPDLSDLLNAIKMRIALQ